MNPNAITAQFDLQTSWFLNALENFTEPESNITYSENLNPVKWVAGHLTNSRMTLYGLVSGDAIPTEYNTRFGKGTSPKTDKPLPPLEQIKADWSIISEKLKTTLRNIPEEKLLSKAPFQTSIQDETLLGLIAYFAIHESFHIGQLSVYRKLASKTAMNLGRR